MGNNNVLTPVYKAIEFWKGQEINPFEQSQVFEHKQLLIPGVEPLHFVEAHLHGKIFSFEGGCAPARPVVLFKQQ